MKMGLAKQRKQCKGSEAGKNQAACSRKGKVSDWSKGESCDLMSEW